MSITLQMSKRLTLHLYVCTRKQKSTFIRMLTGSQPIDSGTIEPGETVVFGVYDQMGIPFLDEQQTVLQFITQRVESGPGATMAEAPGEAMKMLRQFQFPKQRWNER